MDFLDQRIRLIWYWFKIRGSLFHWTIKKSVLVQVMAWHIANDNDDLVHLHTCVHDDVIKWKHFPRYWPFVRGIHRSPVNSPHKGQWRGALIFTLICARINVWVNNREAGDLRRNRVHYDVIVMLISLSELIACAQYQFTKVTILSVQ